MNDYTGRVLDRYQGPQSTQRRETAQEAFPASHGVKQSSGAGLDESREQALVDQVKAYQEEVGILNEQMALLSAEAGSREEKLHQQLATLRADGEEYPWEGVGIDELLTVFKSNAKRGSLNQGEFNQVLRDLGVTAPAGARALFQAFDRNKDLELDFQEAFTGLVMLLRLSFEEEIEAAFMIIDIDGNGGIRCQEAESFLMSVSPVGTPTFDCSSMAARIMREADQNRTGLITWQEFLRWPGKSTVVQWIQAHQGIRVRVRGRVRLMDGGVDSGTPGP